MWTAGVHCSREKPTNGSLLYRVRLKSVRVLVRCQGEGVQASV